MLVKNLRQKEIEVQLSRSIHFRAKVSHQVTCTCDISTVIIPKLYILNLIMPKHYILNLSDNISSYPQLTDDVAGR